MLMELWTACRADWGFATHRIAQAFRANRSLGSRSRREVSQTLYDLIRQSRRLEYALEPTPSERIREIGIPRATYLAWALASGAAASEEVMAEEPGIPWDAVAAVDERIASCTDPVRRFALTHSLPDWLGERLLRERPSDASELAAALNERAPLMIRANTLLTGRNDLAARLEAEGVESTPTRFAPHGLVLRSRINVFGLDAFREGLFEVQDEGSQLIAEVVAPPPRSVVVDFCAGAGGKTLAIAAQMQNKGVIRACDVSARKLEGLRRRARRAGLSNYRGFTIDPEGTDPELEALEARAHRVLADVPCDGLGALRRNPEARWRLTAEDLEMFPPRQLAIARRARHLVKPGGRLIYATCTILRAENEDVVEQLVAADPEFEPVRIAEILGTERSAAFTDPTGTYLRTLPHVHGCDGFFAAVLRRAPAP